MCVSLLVVYRGLYAAVVFILRLMSRKGSLCSLMDNVNLRAG